MPPPSETLLTAWSSLVRAAPAECAVIEAATGEIISRAALDARADVLARAWRAAQPTLAGSWVVYSRANGVGWFAVFLALLKTGAVPVPLNPSELPDFQRALGAAARAQFLLGADDTLIALSAPRRRAPPDLALVKLTSGSTGAPRALAFTHAQMLADGCQVCASMDIRTDDLNLALIPLGHSYGLGNLVVPLLARGTPLVCASAPLHHALAADCERWRPTVFPAVPAILRVLAQTDVPPEALRSLRVVISAGSALPAETARAFFEKFGRRIHGFYGSSETGGIAYDRSGDATLTGRAVGTPLDGVRLRFGRARCFTVVSAAVFTLGNRDPGSHRPADLAELNAQGELVLLGRAGRMVKIAARRLDLTALERELRQLPGIRDAYAAPHPSRPEELACAVATELSAAEARAVIHRSLAAWKIPKRLIALKDFPLTARGKPDTRALRAKLRD